MLWELQWESDDTIWPFRTESAAHQESAGKRNRSGPLSLRLGFTIEYTDSETNLRYNEPDIVAVDRDGAHYVIETKGQENIDVYHKDRVATIWCENATLLADVTWALGEGLEPRGRNLSSQSSPRYSAMASTAFRTSCLPALVRVFERSTWLDQRSQVSCASPRSIACHSGISSAVTNRVYREHPMSLLAPLRRLARGALARIHWVLSN